jgi:SAM-dependent methyltransferase
VDDATARALNAINQRFYRAQARAFSATREGPWPGWQRLWEALEAGGLPPDAAVLDVGCGNARLGRFLAERMPKLRYLGLDASPELLAIARAGGGLGPEPELLEVDLLEDDLEALLAARRFDLVSCFGLLHHLPGRDHRLALLRTLLERLAPVGLLALTCWQLAGFARFRDRVVPWESLGSAAIDPAQLEPGDHLLPWGEGAGLRYVHFAHEDETAELLAELGCTILVSYVADGRDGRFNRYFLARSPAP